MYKVILDCDNTMGVMRSDIDDGLTFAYLYGHPDIELLGITCTFANNHEHVVYYNTMQMLLDMHITDIPVYRGGRRPQEYDSEAVDFLVKSADENPGELVIIAIGSMCNIAGAYVKDPSFFNKINRLIVMGGVLEPLYLNGVHCTELNFSSDYVSANLVVSNCKKMTILTAQATQHAVFGQYEMERLRNLNTPFIRYILPIVDHWIDYIGPAYGGIAGFINWDLCTAIYLTNPELFDIRRLRIVDSLENMKQGLLVVDKENQYPQERVNDIDMPAGIKDLAAFNELFFDILKRITLGENGV